MAYLARREAPWSGHGRVEIVVDRESADLHSVSDVFDGLAKRERTKLVEASHYVLFSESIEGSHRTAQFSFNLIDETVECSLQTAGPKGANNFAFPDKVDVAFHALSDGHDGAT